MTWSPSGMSSGSEIIGTPVVRGFLPVPMTLTISLSAGTKEKPFISKLISIILIASSQGTSLLMKILTLPWTKLYFTSFLPVSDAYKRKMSSTSLFGYCRRTIFGAPGGGVMGGGAASADTTGATWAKLPGATWAKTPVDNASRTAATQKSLSTVV